MMQVENRIENPIVHATFYAIFVIVLESYLIGRFQIADFLSASVAKYPLLKS